MEQDATKKNLRIVVQPRLTDKSMDINIDVNRNLAPSMSIWLYYEREADELNEKRLAELDEAHAAVLRNFMQQTAELDAIEKANGIRFRDSRISLSIGRAYDLCEFIDQISKAINQVLDPRHELGKPEIVMDDSAYINDIIAPDLDTLLRAFIDFIHDDGDENDTSDSPDTPDAPDEIDSRSHVATGNPAPAESVDTYDEVSRNV